MRLFLNTVSDALWECLKQLMNQKEFHNFRLVGGTALSLQLGHRESVDIDLFTDASYGSVDFELLEKRVQELFPVLQIVSSGTAGMGKSYFVGMKEEELVKLDLYYTDAFVFPMMLESGVRFASQQEIAAMKFEVVENGGRKKDFWDVHELLDHFSLQELFGFHAKRHPFTHNKDQLLLKLLDFHLADSDFTPNCYRGKDWELIKFDLTEKVRAFLGK